MEGILNEVWLHCSVAFAVELLEHERNRYTFNAYNNTAGKYIPLSYCKCFQINILDTNVKLFIVRADKNVRNVRNKVKKARTTCKRFIFETGNC